MAFVCGVLMASCGKSPEPAAISNSTIMKIDTDGVEWAISVKFTTSAEGYQLTLNGASIELRDANAYVIDWGALGVSGLTSTTSYEKKSTEPMGKSFLTVLGRPVEVMDGTLMWGEDSLGAISDGSQFVVDAKGLRALSESE